MCFEAVLELKIKQESFKGIDVAVVFKNRVRASVFFYKTTKSQPKKKYARIHPQKSLTVKWKDFFELKDLKTNKLVAQGKVLLSKAENRIPQDVEKHIEFLNELDKKEEDMLFSLVKRKKFQGLSQKEISDLTRLSESEILDLSQDLEQKKKVRIVSFNPILMVSRTSLDLLEKKVLTLIKNFSEEDSEKNGMSLEEIKEKVQAHSKVIELTVNYLKYLNRITESDHRFILSPPEKKISKEDEKLVREMDQMCQRGEFKNYSFEELKDLFGISYERFDRLFNVLLERRKVIHGKEGFIFYSDWLKNLIDKLKESGTKQFSVADFKKISGLSRKYAIPLLELLAEKGVTRREGSLHKIL